MAISDSKQVLLVENDSVISSTLTQMLEVLGRTVISVGSGADAIDSLKHNPQCELVVVDANLSDINISQFILRAKKEKPDLQVLITSGYPEEFLKGTSRLPQGSKVINKPFTISQLQAAVASCD